MTEARQIGQPGGGPWSSPEVPTDARMRGPRARGIGLPRSRAILFLLSLAAVLQTLLYSAYLRDDPGNYNGAGAFGDQVEYIALAQQLLRGEWEGRGHYMPLYPALLAASQTLVGDARVGIVLLQAILYAALVLVAARLAASVFGPNARIPAAALVALNPTLGYYAGQALTEFVTGILLFGIAASLHHWWRQGSTRMVVLAGVLAGALGYIRSEYLTLAAVLALVLALVGRRQLGGRRAVLMAGTFLLLAWGAMLPWIGRNALVLGRPTLYEVSPVSNLVLMGTWFRAFDEQTFAELQRIQRARVSDEEAVAQASRVGPRPDLSARYMAQARGSYDLPLDVAARESLENIRLNLPRYLVNHLVLAPVLIWAGHTPVRQADLQAVPSLARWALWAAQGLVVVGAVWQALRLVRDPRGRLLAAVFLSMAASVTVLHVFIAVDDRFTVPLLAVVQTFASGWFVGRAAWPGWFSLGRAARTIRTAP